jgi:hypothetical protein
MAYWVLRNEKYVYMYLRGLEPSTVDKPVMHINICIPTQYFMKISKMNKAAINWVPR